MGTATTGSGDIAHPFRKGVRPDRKLLSGRGSSVKKLAGQWGKLKLHHGVLFHSISDPRD